MAAYIPVPRDLSRVKTKVAFGLTARQLLCIATGAAVGFPLYFLLRRPFGSTTALFWCLLVLIPIFLLAAETPDGPPMEVRLWYFVQAVFVRPRIRPYETRNIYDTLTRYRQAREEADRIVQQAHARAARRNRRRRRAGKPESPRGAGRTAGPSRRIRP